MTGLYLPTHCICTHTLTQTQTHNFSVTQITEREQRALLYHTHTKQNQDGDGQRCRYRQLSRNENQQMLQTRYYWFLYNIPVRNTTDKHKQSRGNSKEKCKYCVFNHCRNPNKGFELLTFFLLSLRHFL